MREVLLQLFFDRQVGIEQVERLLREVTHLQACAELDGPFVRANRAGDHFQQGRFAGAVLPHHRPPLAAPDCQRQLVVHHAAAVALRDAGQRRHLVA